MKDIFKEIESAGVISPVKLAFLKEMYEGTHVLNKDKDKTMDFMMKVIKYSGFVFF